MWWFVVALSGGCLAFDAWCDGELVAALGTDGEAGAALGGRRGLRRPGRRAAGGRPLGPRSGRGPRPGRGPDACYREHRDNDLDIILVGDGGAARSVVAVEVPSGPEGYLAAYNAGGPDPDPYEGVARTAPSPPHTVQVVSAIDDPMRVDRAPR